eukprot:symbB.v1.2.024197.t2/scaffold2271.1/size83755/5
MSREGELCSQRMAPDKARVTVRGSEKEVAKCKQTVKAVVDGALSLATLGSLAGVKGLKAAEENEEITPPGRPGPLPTVSLPTMPGAPSPAVLAAMAAGARPLAAGQLPPVPPPHLAAAAAAAVPGMPENHQMQANLNDYYARWWTSYTLGEDQPEADATRSSVRSCGSLRLLFGQEEKPKEQPMAFDKEAWIIFLSDSSSKSVAAATCETWPFAMALSCTAASCDEWREKQEAAKKACEESRYFEAVQLINAALEAFEPHLPAAKDRPGQLLTEPQRFVKETKESLGEAAQDLADLWATRADILMNLGGLKRASNELAAALELAPEALELVGPGISFNSYSKITMACALAVMYEMDCGMQEEGIAEEALAAAQNKVPAHILTGFLGSGKTTLLNHILRETHGKRFAVIENEFGEIGIDDKLIARREDLGAEQIIEMNNGCICCTVRGDLIQGLRSILKKTTLDGNKLDGVIIETTGLADPAPVAQTFFADDVIQARMTLDGIITVVDAKHCLQHLHEEKPEGVENEAVEQLAFADRIIVNKTDLVTEAELSELTREVRKINGVAPMIYTQNSKVQVQEIMGIKGFSLDRVLESDAEFLSDQDHQHDQSVSSVGIECAGECDQEKLNNWIAKLLRERGTDIFRTKGVLAVKGCDQRFVFQGIHMIFGGQPQDDWSPGEERVNRLIFIGRNLNRDELQRGLNVSMNSQALQRLADRAQAGELEEPPPVEPPPPPPMPDMMDPGMRDMGYGHGMEDRSVVRDILGLPGNSMSSADGPPAPPPVPSVMPGSAQPMTFGASQRRAPELTTLKGFLRRGAFDDEIPQTKKDADSVQKMLERLQESPGRGYQL